MNARRVGSPDIRRVTIAVSRDGKPTNARMRYADTAGEIGQERWELLCKLAQAGHDWGDDRRFGLG